MQRGGPFRDNNENFQQAFQKILSMPHLTEQQRKHLFHVYSVMLGGVASTAIGAFSGITAAENGWLSVGTLNTLGALGVLFCVIALAVERASTITATPKNNMVRELAEFGGLSFSMGLSMVGMLLYSLFVDGQILITAIMGSLAVFVSLTLAALFARRRSMLWLYSIAGTISSYMMFSMLGSWLFGGSNFFHQFFVFGGLALSVMYILADTQLITERAEEGSRSVVHHAVSVYMDLITLFIRLLALLLDKKEEGGNRNSRRKRN